MFGTGLPAGTLTGLVLVVVLAIVAISFFKRSKSNAEGDSED